MPFNYEKAKEFFYNKLGRDLEGQGRMESAYYHTAEFIYNEGCKDNDAPKDAEINRLVLQNSDLIVEVSQLKAAIRAMLKEGGSVEFQARFDEAKQLIKKDWRLNARRFIVGLLPLGTS